MLTYCSPYSPELTAPKQCLRVIVARSYRAKNEDELSLKLGQIVEVIGKEKEGWWRGSVNGKEGIFPVNKIQLIPEDESTSQGAQEQQEQTESSAPGTCMC